jgi:polysaccharide pyruvyl transferase WcaK-like protein
VVASQQKPRSDTTDLAPVVAYLGWHGRGNLGDDAIYDAVRLQLPEATFLDLPRFGSEAMFAAATGLNRSVRRGPQVIGGGTLVGTRYFRRLVNRGMRLTRNDGSYAIGVGVEDPVFVRRVNRSDRDELTRWAPMLAEFRIVSVRGPRSAELLSDIGLDVEVSGDPALLLPRPDVAPEEGLIGLNLGFGDNDLWGKDPATVADEMSGAMRHLSSEGYRFVGILMNGEDQRWTEAALDGIAADIVFPADAAAAARELARCSVAIVSRLHAGILAAISDTPVVSLEYLPKCRDFALSIDDERSLIRTDTVTSTAVVDKVTSALADCSAIRTKTNAAVAKLRQRLSVQYSAVRRQLGLEAE